MCELLDAIEQQVSAAPAESFSLDADGTATLHVKSRSYHAGQFEVAQRQLHLAIDDN